MRRTRQPGMKARPVLALALAIGFLAQASNVLAQDAPKAKPKKAEPAAKADNPKADNSKAPTAKTQTITRQPAAPGVDAKPTKASGAKKGLKGKKTKRTSKTQASAKRGRGIPKPTVVLKPGEVPKIKFDTPVYDFGKIAAGTQIKHEYWFTNTGTGPLEILKIKPG